MRFVSLVLVLLSAAAAPAADPESPPGTPREIKVKGLPLPRPGKPTPFETVITSRDQLARLVPDRAAREPIARRVDFKKERLVLLR
jgi:hypothetical protein